MKYQDKKKKNILWNFNSFQGGVLHTTSILSCMFKEQFASADLQLLLPAIIKAVAMRLISAII